MSEYDIDMDRAMQGIDDEGAQIKNLKWDNLIHFPIDFTGTRIRVTDRNNQIYVHNGFNWEPEITWTNCADEMPSDRETIVIVRSWAGYKALHIDTAINYINSYPKETIEWTPYTPEKWKELYK